ncbi:MAG: DUF115 domain-containing protein [Lachnoclostridium sp.]|nr:DUF115 domain-containing protein [Lachnoclostridium sp.]
MMKTTSDKISDIISQAGSTLKSLVKIAVSSRGSDISKCRQEGDRIIIMGNGPSLAETIESHHELMKTVPLMAVNFAANTSEFFALKPRYYILADPHFFKSEDKNVKLLLQNLANVDWKMTLIIPSRARIAPDLGANVEIRRFNMVSAEGFDWFEDKVYSSGLAMPRPRNVLIPAIMTSISMGYKKIYIVGADHSWTRTLSVNERNEVVSIQPHFYAESKEESERVTAVYRDVKLHEIINSFYVAFKAYHRIERFARRKGVTIYNSTPGSFIDAFERRPLPES